MAHDPSHGPLAGHTALVTGAASGIGAAVARRMAADGATVLAVDLDGAGVKALARDVPGIEPVVCDLSDLDAVDALPAEVDVLVNNAGLQHVAPIEEFPPERFSQILTIMLEAPFRLARRTLPHMYARAGAVSSTSPSVHGLRAQPVQVGLRHGQARPGGAVQGGRAGGRAARGHQQLHQPGLRAHPAGGEADRRPGAPHGIAEDEVVEKVMLTPVAVKRLVEPDEVAELAAVLCGPASASLTGASLRSTAAGRRTRRAAHDDGTYFPGHSRAHIHRTDRERR